MQQEVKGGGNGGGIDCCNAQKVFVGTNTLRDVQIRVVFNPRGLSVAWRFGSRVNNNHKQFENCLEVDELQTRVQDALS